MDSRLVYSSKAEKYAKYRWEYARECIQAIFAETGITEDACIADIGAGTGILTRQFIGQVRQVFAVEPNPEMRAVLARQLGHLRSCQILAGCAQATGLPAASISLLTVGQAIHWFDPLPARQEFFRILQPGGWLAICQNQMAAGRLAEALGSIYPAARDDPARMPAESAPASFYFAGVEFLQRKYPFRLRLCWPDFLGGLSTSAAAPDEDSSLFAGFKRSARRVFDRYCTGDSIELHVETELFLGRPAVVRAGPSAPEIR